MNFFRLKGPIKKKKPKQDTKNTKSLTEQLFSDRHLYRCFLHNDHLQIVTRSVCGELQLP